MGTEAIEPTTLEEITHAMTAIVEGAENRSLTDDEVTNYEGLETKLQATRKTDEIRKRNAAYEAPRVHIIPVTPKGDQALEFAYDAYLRTGQRNMDIAGLENRDQSTTTTTSGGYLVPPGYLTRIVNILKNFGGVRRVAEIMPTASGQPIQFPTNDDTANSAAIATEATAVGSGGADLLFGQVTLGAWEYVSTGASQNPLRIPLSLMQDSAFDIGSYVTQKLAMRVARKQAVDFVQGTGSSQPKGLNYRIPDMNLATGNAFVYSGPSTAPGLLQVVHKLDPDYREGATWLMNDATVALIEGVVDSTGRPLLMPYALSSMGADPGQAGAATDGAGYRLGQMLLGYPVVIDQAFPVVQNASVAPPGSANDGFISFGNHNEAYIIREVLDFTILVNPYTRQTQREVEYVGFARADATIKNSKAHVILAGYHA